jgi:small subunit ribosomal protein S1
VKSRLSKKGALRNLKRVFPVETAVGDIFDGVVSNIVNFGVFIRITDDYDALLHKSELGVDSESALKTFVPGDQIRVEVVHIDRESERVNVRPVVSDGT